MRAREILLTLLFAALGPAATWATPYESSGITTDYHLTSTWSPTGVPGQSDSATILNGHTVVTSTNISPTDLIIKSGGTLIVQGCGVHIFASTVTVEPAGRLRGAGPGSTVYILPQSPGVLEVRNDGLIRGGSPSGGIFIADAAEPCPNNGSKILSNEGAFIGGLGGSIYMVAEEIDLRDAEVETETGNVPYNVFTGQTSTGSIYIGGVDISLRGFSSGLTRVLSGSNVSSAPGSKAGRVFIVANDCPGASTNASLLIDVNAVVDVGTPTIGNCPELVLFSAGTSMILGNVGSYVPSSSCTYWDPPDLELLGSAQINGDRLILVGENFHAALTGTGLRATDTIEITLAPGGVLDLQALTPGPNYFEAGTGITLCSDNILLQPGVDLDDLMVPAPQVCPGSEIVRLSLSPGTDHLVNPGDSIHVPWEVVNVGNATGVVDVTLDDSAGWLASGPLVFNRVLAPGESIALVSIITVPPSASGHTVLSLTGQVTGQPLSEEKSTFGIASVFADGFESGNVAAWSGVSP